jgi:hypothetical protein
MKITASIIQVCTSDEKLHKLLTAELERRIPSKLHDNLDALVLNLHGLPPGLRAMAATFQSM